MAAIGVFAPPGTCALTAAGSPPTGLCELAAPVGICVLATGTCEPPKTKALAKPTPTAPVLGFVETCGVAVGKAAGHCAGVGVTLRGRPLLFASATVT